MKHYHELSSHSAGTKSSELEILIFAVRKGIKEWQIERNMCNMKMNNSTDQIMVPLPKMALPVCQCDHSCCLPDLLGS